MQTDSCNNKYEVCFIVSLDDFDSLGVLVSGLETVMRSL